MTPTRRIIIRIPVVTGPGSENQELCDLACPGLNLTAPHREASCRLFPRKSDGGPRWLTKHGTGYPTRCRQCREAEVK